MNRMEMTINPVSRANIDQYVLSHLFLKIDLVRYTASDYYHFHAPDFAKPSKKCEYRIRLTVDVIGYYSNHQAKRYFCFTNQKPVGAGAFGNIVSGIVLKPASQHSFSFSNHAYVMKLQYITDSNSYASYQNEYQLMRRLSYYHVKPLIWFNNTNGLKQCGIVMRHLPGQRLIDVINDDIFGIRPITTDERINLHIQLFYALQQLHQVNIIHRDLKPENILVVIETMQIYIIDMGLSKDKFYDDSHESVGTPDYASPEAFLMRGTDFRSDDFTLALLLKLLWLGEPRTHHTIMNINCLREEPIFGLFRSIKDLLDKHKQIIGQSISHMLQYNVSLRANLQQIIPMIEQIKFERLQYLAREHYTEEFKSIYYHTLYINQQMSIDSSLLVIRDYLINLLNNLRHNPDALLLFQQTIKLTILKTSASTKLLENKLRDEVDSLETTKQSLVQLRNEINYILLHKKSLPKLTNEKLDALYHDLTATIDKYQRLVRNNIDHLFTSKERFKANLQTKQHEFTTHLQDPHLLYLHLRYHLEMKREKDALSDYKLQSIQLVYRHYFAKRQQLFNFFLSKTKYTLSTNDFIVILNRVASSQTRVEIMTIISTQVQLKERSFSNGKEMLQQLKHAR